MVKLTEKEKEMIESMINGLYSPFTASDEDIELANTIIEKADNYRIENCKDIDEIEDDLMAWFYSKCEK